MTTSRENAELSERLLGEWMHAVLVRDQATVRAIQEWHGEQQPGALVLLPLDSGPSVSGDLALDERLHVQEPAVNWVRAALAGSEVLDAAGRVLRRGNGAIFLSGAGVPSGPLRRRAELGALVQDVERATAALAAADAALEATIARLAERERILTTSTAAADLAREAERQAVAAREDAARLAGNLARESSESAAELQRITERVSARSSGWRRSTPSWSQVSSRAGGWTKRSARVAARLAELESGLEDAREHRVHWQVQEAHVAGGLRSAEERLSRASVMRDEAERGMLALTEELTRLETEAAAATAQQDEWNEQRAERQVALATSSRRPARRRRPSWPWPRPRSVMRSRKSPTRGELEAVRARRVIRSRYD